MKIFWIFIFCMSSAALTAGGMVDHNRNIGFKAKGFDLIENRSGGYVIVGFGGYEWENKNPSSTIWSLDSNGQLDRSFGDGGILTLSSDNDSQTGSVISVYSLNDNEYTIITANHGYHIDRISIKGELIERKKNILPEEVSYRIKKYSLYSIRNSAVDSSGNLLVIARYITEQYNPFENDVKESVDFLYKFDIHGNIIMRFVPAARFRMARSGELSAVLLSANSVCTGSEGKILITGDIKTSDSGIKKLFTARFMPNGTLDKSFHQDGFQILQRESSGTAVLCAEDGSIYVAGEVQSEVQRSLIALWKWNNDGTLDFWKDTRDDIDNSFSHEIIAEHETGRIIILGYTGIYTGFAPYERVITLVRFNKSGEPDINFGIGVVVTIGRTGGDYNDCGYDLITDGQNRASCKTIFCGA